MPQEGRAISLLSISYVVLNTYAEFFCYQDWIIWVFQVEQRL